MWDCTMVLWWREKTWWWWSVVLGTVGGGGFSLLLRIKFQAWPFALALKRDAYLDICYLICIPFHTDGEKQKKTTKKKKRGPSLLLLLLWVMIPFDSRFGHATLLARGRTSEKYVVFTRSSPFPSPSTVYCTTHRHSGSSSILSATPLLLLLLTTAHPNKKGNSMGERKAKQVSSWSSLKHDRDDDDDDKGEEY